MTVLLIDLHNLAFRAAHAFQNLWSGDVHTGLYHGTFKMLMTYVKDINPDIVAIVSDPMTSGEKDAWRRQYLPEYKAHRKSSRTEQQQRHYNAIQAQLPVLKWAIHLLPVYWFEQPFIEADDLIAYLTKYFWADEHCIIISTDKDLFQLVDDTTTVFYPGQRNRLWIRGMDFSEKVSRFVEANKKADASEQWLPQSPAEWLDYRILVGDTSDGIKGLTGIGPIRGREIMRHGGINIYRDRIRQRLARSATRKIKLNKTEQYLLSDEADKKLDLNRLLMELPSTTINQSIDLTQPYHGQCVRNVVAFRAWCQSFSPPLKEIQKLTNLDWFLRGP